MAKQILCTKELHTSGGKGTFHLGCSRELLPMLLGTYEEQVQLIYLDPPFLTGDVFQIKANGKTLALPAYTDTLDQSAYLDMMRSIIEGCHRLLRPSGSFYLHIDYRMAAHLRLIADEIFGADNLMNELIWMYKSGGRSTRHYPRKHDTILFYRKSRKVYFNIEAVSARRGPERRNHMRRFIDDRGRICYSIRSAGKTYIYHEDMPVFPCDVWTDIEHLHQRDPERSGYATQKPEALLRRILLASSEPGDLIMDLFSGSGTTAAVASKEGRRFIVCDQSPFAMYSIRKRQFRKNISLLEEDQPFEICFSSGEVNATVEAGLEQEGERTLCTVYSYAGESKTAGLLYCSLGTIVQDTYIPFTGKDMPSLPITLRMPRKKHVVLQTVDMDGTQAFWEVGQS